jgi:plastocyanin
MNRHLYRVVALSALLVAAACSGEKKESDEDRDKPSEGAPAPASAGASVKPTGKVIVVELFTDEKGNYFKPAKFEAHRGDLIRFTLAAGVHNVHFLADSNPGKQGLPPASDMLQLPGQTYELLVSFAPGKYFFQCDPHALLGMVGHLEVEEEN